MRKKIRLGLLPLLVLIIATTATLSLPASALQQTEPGELSSDEFTSPNVCAGCHGMIYSQWSGSMHAKADADPFYNELLQMASKDTDGLIDTYCPRCHTPIGLVGGEIPPVDGTNLSEIATMGVLCDFCHSVTGMIDMGNAQYILSPDNIKRGPFDDAKSPFHETEYSELHTKSEFCGMCHDVSHPVNGLVLEATYTEWKNGPYFEDGVQCQDCHMTPGITHYEANPGRAAAGAPKRDNIFIHNFEGANVFMAKIFEDDAQRDMAILRLQKAATLTVSAPKTAEAGDEVTIDVAVTNVGAGHKIPTGLSEIRQMWLDIEVTDAEGNIIYRSGAIDDGIVDPSAVMYNTIVAGPDGKPTFKFWLAEKKISDKRIPPRETTVEKYSFDIPQDITNPIIVNAKLRYRSADQKLINDLFGKNKYEVPIIDMAVVSTGINGQIEAETDDTTQTPGFGVLQVAGVLLVIATTTYRKRKGL